MGEGGKEGRRDTMGPVSAKRKSRTEVRSSERRRAVSNRKTSRRTRPVSKDRRTKR